MDALAEIAPPPRALAEALFGAENLKPAAPDPDPLRTAAASKAGLNAIDKCLDDADNEVRSRALRAAGQWGRHAHALEVRVARFLRDPDPATRYVAVQTCGHVGASAALIMDDLIAIVREDPIGRVPKDPRPSTRRAAVALITKFGDAARPAISTLRRLVDDPEVGENARDALRKLEPLGR